MGFYTFWTRINIIHPLPLRPSNGPTDPAPFEKRRPEAFKAFTMRSMWVSFSQAVSNIFTPCEGSKGREEAKRRWAKELRERRGDGCEIAAKRPGAGAEEVSKFLDLLEEIPPL